MDGDAPIRGVCEEIQDTGEVNLSIQPQLRYALCVPCERVFKCTATLKGHLEKKRRESSREAKKRADDITAAAEKDVTKEILELREKYVKAPLDEVDQICGSLPALIGVEKSKAFKCPSCEYYALRKKTMIQHLQDVHKQTSEDASEKTEGSWKRGAFSVQSLQGGYKTRYFRVRDCSENDDNLSHLVPTDDPPAIRAQPSEGEDGAHEYDLDFFADVCEEGGPDVHFSEQDEGGELQTHNEFIAATKVPEILKQEGIEVLEAVKLTGQLEKANSLDQELARLGEMYLQNVAACASTAAPALLETLLPRNDKAFQPVGKKTVRRYSHCLAKLLSFAARSSSCNWIDKATSDLLRNQSRLCSPLVSDDVKLAEIHLILKELCLSHRSRSAGVEKMFMRIYFACISVRATKNDEGETYRFVEASEVSRNLAALQHIIVGTALVELTKIGRGETDTVEPASTESEDWQKRIREEEDKVMLKISRTENTPMSFVRVVLFTFLNKKWEQHIFF